MESPVVERLAPEGRVCVVVVTYNRKDLLRPCLESILSQTRLPDHIAVIENHGTDGTLEMLRAEYEKRKDGPPFTILPQAENSGGAGGFAAGVDWAHRQGFDWLWLTDDDVEMLPGALAMLLAHRGVSEFIQCRRQLLGVEIKLDSVWDLSAGTAAQPSRTLMHVEGDRPWLSVQWGNFEGALIHRSVVDRLGPPDARFFIAGDDSTYGLESSFFTNVIYIKEVGVVHRVLLKTRQSRLGWYLMLRNRFLVREHLRALGFNVHPLPFWAGQLVGLLWGCKAILRDAEEPAKWVMLRTLIGGLIDGANGHFGRPPFIKP